MGLVLVFFVVLGADKKTAAKSSKEAGKEYNAAVALLNSNQVDQGYKVQANGIPAGIQLEILS